MEASVSGPWKKVRKSVTKLLLHLPESDHALCVLVRDNERTENGDVTVSKGRDWLSVSGRGACCHIQPDLVSLGIMVAKLWGTLTQFPAAPNQWMLATNNGKHLGQSANKEKRVRAAYSFWILQSMLKQAHCF